MAPSLARLAGVIRPNLREVRGHTAVSQPLWMIDASSELDFRWFHLPNYESGLFLLIVLGDVEFLSDPPSQHALAGNIRNGVSRLPIWRDSLSEGLKLPIVIFLGFLLRLVMPV